MSDVDSMEPDVNPVIKQNDDVLQQYPLPVAEVQHTSSLYASEHSHVGHDHRHNVQQAQQYGHGHQDQDQGQRSPSPRLQTEDSAITSAEELRIAAQLSQDLSQDLSQGITSMLNEPDHHQNDDYSLRNGTAQREESDDKNLQTSIEQSHHQQHGQDEGLAQEISNHNDQHTSHVEEPLPLPADEPSVKQTEGSLQSTNEQSSQSPFLSDEQQSLGQQSLGQQSHERQALEQPPQYRPDQQQHNQQMQRQLVSDQPPLLQPLSAQQPQPLQQIRPPPLQPHSSIDQLAQQYANHAYHSVQDHIPPRKRSKVSRACDECRRKKVKCDATSETGEETCSNCRRSAIRCLFSRIPQKRGPSKGYIKELADRINHIEGKLASEGNIDALTEILGSRRESSDVFSPPAQHDESSRKRPYSNISGAELSTPNSLRQGNWGSEPRPIQPHQTPPNGAKTTPYSANGLAPQPLTRLDVETPSRTVAPLNEMSIDLDHSTSPKELINDSFDVYLNVVHPCFPFLAGTKAGVEAHLSRCPSLLRDAFIEAFYGTMQSCVSAPGLFTNGDIGSATRIVAAWESDASSPRNLLTNIVHLQALILMAIATDNYGSSSLKGEHGGPSKASILGRAVGLAYSMRLHVASCSASPNPENNGDTDECIAIRTWWTLVMLDRWNALSTASPLFIPNDSVVILPGLISVLGENVYHLTRLSNILGHFAPVSLAPPQALSSDASAVPILNSFFNLAIELFREVLPANITPATHPILNLVYWHSRLLSYLFQTNARSQDVIWACKESVDLLLNNTALLSPLNHHFFSLTTLSLLELAKLDKTHDEVTPLLKDLLTRNLAPSTWDGIIRDCIDHQLQHSTTQAGSGPDLQRLASLATASKVNVTGPENGAGAATLRTSTTYAHLGFDPRPILRTGYLNVLAERSSSRDSLG
ncbi:hypothetical protein F4861DRAFT_407102 [Xylaria intraflava]|nr:hypothetical protein F4861DRAFT_407102 [Xylaria intraflava]